MLQTQDPLNPFGHGLLHVGQDVAVDIEGKGGAGYCDRDLAAQSAVGQAAGGAGGAPQPPAWLRCDRGPEILAQTLGDWCEAHGVVLHHIAPGKPSQNAFIERFNKTYRTEVLDAWVFTSLVEVRQITEEWLEIYNAERRHSSLGRVPPRTYLPRPVAA